MALPAEAIIEVRATVGNDLNGGAFVPGTVGTADYSQQDGPQKSDTDLTIHASDNTKVRPPIAGVAAADVNNYVNIVAGSGFTGGKFRITGQDGAYWTLDRAAGTAGSSAGVYRMGGALATWDHAMSIFQAGNVVYFKKSATYNIGAAMALPANAATDFATRSRIIGYETIRTDRGRPIFQATAGSFAMFTNTTKGQFSLENLDFDGNNQTGGSGVTHNGSYACLVDNCIMRRFAGFGLKSGNTGTVLNTEIHHCGGTNGALEIGSGGAFGANILSHHNTVTGIYVAGSGNSVTLLRTTSAFNTGVSSDGIYLTYGATLDKCAVVGNARDGVRTQYGILLGSIMNSIFWGNTGYGLNSDNSSPFIANPSMNVDYNAFGSNTAGNRSADYPAGPNDVLLSMNPFMDSANLDFTLNDLAGGGALLKGFGSPFYFPG